MNNDEVSKDIQAKFGHLPDFEPNDVKYSNSKYWNWVEKNEGIEPIDNNPNPLNIRSEYLEYLFGQQHQPNNKEIQRVKSAIEKAGLTSSEQLVLDLFFKQIPLNQMPKHFPYKTSFSSCQRTFHKMIAKLKQALNFLNE